MKGHYPKLYNMAHLLALNVLLLPKDLTIIFIYIKLELNIPFGLITHITKLFQTVQIQKGRFKIC